MAVCWDCGGPRSESSGQRCKKCFALKVRRDAGRRMRQFQRYSQDQMYEWAEKITLAFFECGLFDHHKLARHVGCPLVFVNVFFTNMRACGYFSSEHGLMVTDGMMGDANDANILCVLYVMCGAGAIIRDPEDDTYTLPDTPPSAPARSIKPTSPTTPGTDTKENR